MKLNLSIPDHEHQPSIVISLASFKIHVLIRVITGIIYGSVAVSGSEGHTLLERAVDRLLKAEGPQAIALWSMRYNQLGRLSNGGTPPTIQTLSPHVFSFPPPSLDLAFEDETVDMIKQAWVEIVGDEVAHDEFMIFEDREGTSDD
jgi:hypothetical protein